MDRLRVPWIPLTLLGGVSGAIYVAYVALYPLPVHGQSGRLYDIADLARQRPWSAAFYVAGLLVLFACYWLALKLVRRARVPLRIIALFGLAFALILVWLYPVTAIDLFQYIGRARLSVVHGVSPLAVPPSRFPDDPLLYLTGGWTDHVSPYGPAWELLAAAVTCLSPQHVVTAALGFKVLAFIAYSGCLALLAWGCDRDSHAVLLFAWNPLVLLQGTGNGHNDLVMLFWMLLGLLLWKRRRFWAAAIAAITVAALTKAPAALILPFLMAAILRQSTSRERLGRLVGGAGLAIGLTLLAFLPYWPPWANVGGLLAELHRGSLHTILPVLGGVGFPLPLPLPQWAPVALVLVALGGVYLWALVRVWRRQMEVAEAGLLFLFVYLLTSSSYRIWYPTWLVALGALHLTRRTRLRTFLLCLTSELSVLTLTLGYRWLFDGRLLPELDWAAVVAVTAPWQFGLPLVLPPLAPPTWTGSQKWSILPHRTTQRMEEP